MVAVAAGGDGGGCSSGVVMVVVVVVGVVAAAGGGSGMVGEGVGEGEGRGRGGGEGWPLLGLIRAQMYFDVFIILPSDHILLNSETSPIFTCAELPENTKIKYL